MTEPGAFGLLLRQHRVAAGLTQEQLAERAGVSSRVVSDLERGVTLAPQRHTVQQLAEALSLSAQERNRFRSSTLRRSVPLVRAESPWIGDGWISPPAGAPLPVGGFLGATPIGPLVARQTELEVILTSARAVEAGGGRLMLLEGEAGIGKTRLVQEVMLVLRDRGFLVASGRCYEPQQTVPYYPFLDALAFVYANSPVSVQEQASHRWPYLAYLLPDQLGQPFSSSALAQDEQQRLFRSVTAFLIASSERTPIALLVDDLHWVDTASLDLLQHLATHMRAAPALLLGTCRSVDMGRQNSLQRFVYDLNREELLKRLEIRALDQQGTEALIATILGDETIATQFSALIHQHTEGNPFFVREVVRTLIDRGDIYKENGRWECRDLAEIEVPDSIRSTVAERASRLSERAQEVIHEASILGQTFGFDDLHAMIGRGEEEIEEALEQATAAGLVREIGGEKYAFNHALMQNALYAELSGRKKRRLHLAAGEARERTSRDLPEERLSEIAVHFVKGGQPQRALPYTLLAGDAARRVFAHAEAESHYRRSLELARELADREREAEVLEKLGGVLNFLSRADHALNLLEQAAAFYQAMSNREGEGRVEATIGMTHFYRGTAEVGMSRLQERLQSLEGTVSLQTLCGLYEAQSQLFFGTGQYREHLESAERWVKLAQESGDRGMHARASGRYGTALGMLGRVEEGIAAHEEAIALAEDAGEMYALMFALNDLAESYQMGGALSRAMILRERFLQITGQMKYQEEISVGLCGIAQTLMLLGEWQRAREHLERACALVQSQTSWYTSYPRLTLAELCWLEGDDGAARRYLIEGLEIARRNNDLQGIRMGQLLGARLDLEHGHPEAAVIRLEPLLDRPGLVEGQVVDLLPVLAEARLALASDPDALHRVEMTVLESRRRAYARSDKTQLVQALRVQGMLFARTGQPDEAKHAFQEAISLARAMPYPYAVTRTLYEYGMLHATLGESEQARERLEEALAIATTLGARPQIEWTTQALTELHLI